MKDHDARLDLLRVAGAFAVVWVHVAADVVIASPDAHSPAWWIANVFDAAGRWCVPIFVMVSGALLLSRNIEGKIGSFYRRRAARVFPPLVFWTAFYILLQRHLGHAAPAMDVAKTIVKGTPYSHLWYLYMIPGLYLVTPFLRPIVTGSSARTLSLFLVVAFTISSVETLLACVTPDRVTTFLPTFLPFVAYFVAGRYLYAQADRAAPKLCLPTAAVCAALVAIGTGALLPMLGPKSWAVMYSFLNPVVILMALCVFRLGLGLQLRTGPTAAVLGRLAPITLGIYLIHPFWQIVLGKLGLTPFLVHPALGIPLTSLAVFGLSALSAAALGAIPFLRTTVR